MLDREQTTLRSDVWQPVFDLVTAQRLWYSPALGRLSATEPVGGASGGFLSDHVGLGKTIMTLALVRSTLHEQAAPTLVVAPAGLLKQWHAEVAKWLPGVECFVLSKGSLAQQIAGKARGVALVSYHILQRLTIDADVHRVVFDEAHTLPITRPPNANAPARAMPQMHEACAAVRARRRWALTGTPAHSAHSVQSALVALRVDAYARWHYDLQMVSGALGCAAHLAVQLLACMLRRGDAVLQGSLPPIVTHPAAAVDYTAEDREVLLASAAVADMEQASFECARERMEAGGTFKRDLLADGMWARPRAPTAEYVVDPAVADDPRCADGCAICLNEPVGAPESLLPCGHLFCGECMLGWARGGGAELPSCPMCRAPFELREVRVAAVIPGSVAADWQLSRYQKLLDTPGYQERCARMLAAVEALPADPRRPGNVLLTSRPAAVVAKVSALLAEDETANVLVFCNFSYTLHAIAGMLARDDVEVLLGSPQDRRAAAQRFQAGRARVLLLPYTSRLSSGLNLATANHVVLSETASMASEADQALGRAWRIGQSRNVHVWSFA